MPRGFARLLLVALLIPLLAYADDHDEAKKKQEPGRAKAAPKKVVQPLLKAPTIPPARAKLAADILRKDKAFNGRTPDEMKVEAAAFGKEMGWSPAEIASVVIFAGTQQGHANGANFALFEEAYNTVASHKVVGEKGGPRLARDFASIISRSQTTGMSRIFKYCDAMDYLTTLKGLPLLDLHSSAMKISEHPNHIATISALAAAYTAQVDAGLPPTLAFTAANNEVFVPAPPPAPAAPKANKPR
jgi:hypothetical protein